VIASLGSNKKRTFIEMTYSVFTKKGRKYMANTNSADRQHIQESFRFMKPKYIVAAIALMSLILSCTNQTKRDRPNSVKIPNSIDTERSEAKSENEPENQPEPG